MAAPRMTIPSNPVTPITPVTAPSLSGLVSVPRATQTPINIPPRTANPPVISRPSNVPISGPRSNIPIPQPNIPIPQPSVPIPQPSVPISSPNVPISKPGILVPRPNLPVVTPPISRPSNVAVSGPRANIPIPQPSSSQVQVPKPSIPVPKPNQPILQSNVPVSPTQTLISNPPRPGSRSTNLPISPTQTGRSTNLSMSPTLSTPQRTVVEETGPALFNQLSRAWIGTQGTQGTQGIQETQGTQEQIDMIVSLTYPNKSPIIDIRRRDVILEIIGMLVSQPFNQVIEFLRTATSPEYILWNQQSLDEGRTKVAREIMIQQTEETGIKGAGRCRRCHADNLVFAMKQTRSGDEGFTVFVRCAECQYNWRQA